MKQAFRTLTLLLCLTVLLGGMSVTARAAGMEAGEAMAYLEDYAGNVASDPALDRNIQSALEAVRLELPGYATLASLVPALLAIGLALLTKEVYTSLLAGILAGGLLYANFDVWGMVTAVAEVMTQKLSEPWNVGILIFLVLLGMLVNLVNKSGGSAAYGRWASAHIRTRQGTVLGAACLGVLIFIDDYFNCLTVGSVMRPVTDKRGISREKLAYVIDATAAPVCIIAPISSWAAAVSSVAPEGQGLTLFLQSVPYNLYALLTLGCVVLMTLLKLDFGPMRQAEARAMAQTGGAAEEENPGNGSGRGTVADLVLPIAALIVSCVTTMIYTGGFFDRGSDTWMDLIGAFGNSDASVGLMLGAMLALGATLLLYIPRRIISFRDFSESFSQGFQSMVGAILILTFAWTLSGVTARLGATVFVAELVRQSAQGLSHFLPAIVFLIGVGLAFATGTSWGTFGVLLPIVCAVFPSGELMVISVSACLAGAVCGDHCSPISDTTIMASAGARCDHISHVNTQLPYVLTVAAVSFLGYILAGFVQNPWIVLTVSFGVLAMILLFIREAGKGS